MNRFTVTFSHDLLETVRPPTVCLIFTQKQDLSEGCYLARLTARRAASTLDTWIKIKSAQPIGPDAESALRALVTDRALATNLERRLQQTDAVIALSPALSVHLVEKLAGLRGNSAALRSVAAGIDGPHSHSPTGKLQQDAIKMALGVFGILAHQPARYVETEGERETAISRIREDAVIEHDARRSPDPAIRARRVARRSSSALRSRCETRSCTGA